MPTTISPAATRVYSASTTGPADGDLANAASVNGAFQDLETAADASRLCLMGKKLRPHFRVTSSGAANNKVTLQPLGSFLLTTGGIWTVLTHITQTVIDLNAAFVLGGGGAVLPVNTRFYLYAHISGGGALEWILNTTVPDVTLAFSSASTDFAFVGTLTTQGGADTITPVVQEGNLQINQGVNVVLQSGAANAFTSFNPYLDVGGLISTAPPYVSTFLLTLSAVPVAGGDTLFLSSHVGGGGANFVKVYAANTPQDGFQLTMWSEDAAHLSYKWTTGVGSAVGATVLGHYDPR